MKAHLKVLTSDYLQGLDSSRKKANSAVMYTGYFEKISSLLNMLLSYSLFEQMAAIKLQYNIEPQNEYNMDEKDFLNGAIQ